MWLAWLGALLIGLALGLLGSGGSILTVPVLIYIIGEPEKLAIAESLAIVACISLVAFIPYAIKKQVHWKSVLFFGIPGVAGTYGGAALSEFLRGSTQLVIFAVVMLLAAALMIRGKNYEEAKKKENSSHHVGFMILEGLAVGVITGLVGVGGGFLIIPALVLLGGLNMRLAVGTSLLIITIKSLAGFYKYVDILQYTEYQIDWRIIIIFSLIGAAGSLIGKKVGEYISQQMLRKVFGYFLIVMGVYIIYSNTLL
jgi:hypothetical protein